jgi:hypothetical protein
MRPRFREPHEDRIIQGIGRAGAAASPQGKTAAHDMDSLLAEQIDCAAANRPEIETFLAQAEHSAAARFLVAYMPLRDLHSLTADFLHENLELACQSRETAPWGGAMPEEVFLNGVLPYANVSETRERWRAGFQRELAPLLRDCDSPRAAAELLNRTIFERFRVSYHATRRPRPDQSPSESIAAGHASCTGLSILLADACRAVGVPARLAGVPKWSSKAGNHTWIEIWDEGEWRWLGAAGAADRVGWLDCMDDIHAIDIANPLQLIYSVSYRATGTRFPMIWNLNANYLHGIDRSADYLRAH